MEKVKIDWSSKVHSSASQVYSTGLEYCFISENNKQCHPFVFCKDFLQDVVWSTLYKEKISIYNFSYDPKENNICLDKTKLAIVNVTDKEFSKKIVCCADFLEKVCSRLNLIKTTVFEVENLPERKRYENCGIFLLEGSKMWMNSPSLLSMYSLLIRCGMCHTIGDNIEKTLEGVKEGTIKYGNKDASQLRSAYPAIEKILKLGYRKFFYIDSIKNYPKQSIDTIHNDTGISSLGEGRVFSIPCRNRELLKN